MARLRDHLAHRIREIRVELFDEHGVELLADLANPTPHLIRYEKGCTIPGQAILRSIEAAIADGWGRAICQVPACR